jgi:hypothetical protein
MSRSRPPKCPCGRGCGCCGDAGEVRRDRERDAWNADQRELDEGYADVTPTSTLFDEVHHISYTPQSGVEQSGSSSGS